jgi:hypothetical protein
VLHPIGGWVMKRRIATLDIWGGYQPQRRHTGPPGLSAIALRAVRNQAGDGGSTGVTSVCPKPAPL